MHHFIYATKDAWISSGSNKNTTGLSEADQNYGQDQILELKKVYYNKLIEEELSNEINDISIKCSSIFSLHAVCIC